MFQYKYHENQNFEELILCNLFVKYFEINIGNMEAN